MERNQEQRELVTATLARKGVKFVSRNQGRHLIVEGEIDVVDFWPGTGKWIARDEDNTCGFGVKKLLSYLGVNK